MKSIDNRYDKLLRVVSNPTDEKTIAAVRDEVKQLTSRFPLYAGMKRE
jgi:hypothetical protein